MIKEELVKKIAKRFKIDQKKAELIVNDAIAEMASPALFPTPGEEVGFLDNSCTNNCKEAMLDKDLR